MKPAICCRIFAVPGLILLITLLSLNALSQPLNNNGFALLRYE